MVQPIRLTQALQVTPESRLAIVGAGGKTTLMFRLAREYAAPVVLTTSTHLAREQAALADRHFLVTSRGEIAEIFERGISGSVFISGSLTPENRLASLPSDLLDYLAELAGAAGLPVLLEADGARRLPIKAPAEHEPAVPAWVNQVVVVTGLSGLGQPLDGSHVHRPERFSALAQLEPGQPVTPEALLRVLLSPQGSLKNIPAAARKYLVLNQADTEGLQAVAGRMAEAALSAYDAGLVAQLQDELIPVKAVYTPIAGVVLAAGKSSRMGRRAKVLLNWQGETFVHKAARTALEAGLNPVVVVTGAHARSVGRAVADLAVRVVENKAWAEGQSTSLISGVLALPTACGGAIFLLADQPQVTMEVLQALVERHRGTMAAIIAPLVEDRRANPVLFDRVTFAGLRGLRGDTGGRALFAQFPVHWLPWDDALLLLDVDTPEDLKELTLAYESRFETDPG
jgi:molybdenum cofactor cytidylyltransferase